MCYTIMPSARRFPAAREPPDFTGLADLADVATSRRPGSLRALPELSSAGSRRGGDPTHHPVALVDFSDLAGLARLDFSSEFPEN